MPKVSVIIPVYNGAEYVREAVDSALAQCNVNVEVIVVDDGSTDETPTILAGYGRSIRVLGQRNSGHVKARNNGVKVASGEWLAFLDADDQWLPQKLSKQLQVADVNIGMVYTDRENFGDITRVKRTASSSFPLFEGDLFEPLLLGNFVTVSSVIIRREWFDRLGGFDEELSVCEDWDMWLRFSAAGGKAAVCREALTRYRWHAGAMSRNASRMCAGRLKVLQRALQTPRGREVSRTFARKAIAATWRCSAWHAQPTHRWRAFLWYLIAAWYDPWHVDDYKGMIKCCLGRD